MDLTRPPAAHRADAGFTLVEAMIAGTLGVLLLLPVYALLRNSTATAFVVTSRFGRNAQARQMLTMIGEGNSGTGDTNFVRGLRSRGVLLRSPATDQGGQLVISDTQRVNSPIPWATSITSDQTPTLTITCTAPATPVPTCISAGSTVSTSGWLGAAPTLTPPSTGRTEAVGITVVDPYQASRSRQTNTSAVDTYRSQFNLNVQ